MNTCTRMLCSVQWCIGENDTTRVSFICRKEELGFGLRPVPGDHVGDRPVVVAGDQHVLAEDLFLQRGAGVRVDLPGQPQVPGLLAGQFPGDDAAGPGLAVTCSIYCGDVLFPAAGLAAGQGGGQLVQLLAGLGQGGAVEAQGLAVVQFRGVGEDGAAPGTVDVTASVSSGQPAEPVLTDQGAVRCGQGEQVRAVAGRDGPDVGQPGLREVREVARRCCCPASKTTVRSAPCAEVPAAAHTCCDRVLSWVIMSGNWVTSGLLPG